MKMPFQKQAGELVSRTSWTGRTGQTWPAAGGERGMAVIVVIAFLAILFVYIAVNIRALDHLKRELKFVEQKQTHRLAQPEIKTNAVAVARGQVQQP